MKWIDFKEVQIGQRFVFQSSHLVREDEREVYDVEINSRNVSNGELWFFEDDDRVLLIGE
jgi:hypothetical protein